MKAPNRAQLKLYTDWLTEHCDSQNCHFTAAHIMRLASSPCRSRTLLGGRIKLSSHWQVCHDSFTEAFPSRSLRLTAVVSTHRVNNGAVQVDCATVAARRFWHSGTVVSHRTIITLTRCELLGNDRCYMTICVLSRWLNCQWQRTSSICQSCSWMLAQWTLYAVVLNHIQWSVAAPHKSACT